MKKIIPIIVLMFALILGIVRSELMESAWGYSCIDPGQMIGDYWLYQGYTGVCVSDWQNSTECLINDSVMKTYSDAMSCASPISPPADNGTIVGYCNYCSYRLITTALSSCTYALENETYNATVYDANWASCCNITGLDSDCYLDDGPGINKTFTEELKCEEEINMWELAIAVLIIGTVFLLMYFASKIEGDQDWMQPIKLLCNMVALFILLAGLGFGLQILKRRVIEEGITSIVEVTFIALLFVITPLIFIFAVIFIKQMLEWLKSESQKMKLKGGGWPNGKAKNI